jgi:hypothetical protein
MAGDLLNTASPAITPESASHHREGESGGEGESEEEYFHPTAAARRLNVANVPAIASTCRRRL